MQRVSALQFLLKRFDDLGSWLRKNPRSAKAVLSDGFLPLLGLMLSPYGMERLLGSIGWSVDERAIECAFERRGRGDVMTFDRLTQVTRQSARWRQTPLQQAENENSGKQDNQPFQHGWRTVESTKPQSYPSR